MSAGTPPLLTVGGAHEWTVQLLIEEHHGSSVPAGLAGGERQGQGNDSFF